MEEKKVTLRVLNPRGKLRDIDRIKGASKGIDLSGKKIGVLDNTKSGGDELLPYVLENLRKKVPGIQIKIWNIPFALSPEVKEPRLREIADYADAVIGLMGD